MRNKYILLRHGQTIYQNKKKALLYPWPDFVTGLTKKGKEQAEEAANKLKKEKIKLIYSSDFFRTKQTAQIISKELCLKVKLDKRLRDVNWGIFKQGLAKNYLQFFASKEERFTKRPPGGENWRDIKKRILSFLKEIEKKYKNKKILIISHADPLWLLLGAIKGLSERELLKNRNNKNFYPDVGQLLTNIQ